MVPVLDCESARSQESFAVIAWRVGLVGRRRRAKGRIQGFKGTLMQQTSRVAQMIYTHPMLNCRSGTGIETYLGETKYKTCVGNRRWWPRSAPSVRRLVVELNDELRRNPMTFKMSTAHVTFVLLCSPILCRPAFRSWLGRVLVLCRLGYIYHNKLYLRTD